MLSPFATNSFTVLLIIDLFPRLNKDGNGWDGKLVLVSQGWRLNRMFGGSAKYTDD